MKIEEERISRIAVVRAAGELGHLDVDALIVRLKEGSRGGVDPLLLDLSGCVSIATAVISALIGWRLESSLRGGEFWIVSPAPAVTEILNRLDLTRELVRTEGSATDAARALGRSRPPG